LAEPKLWDSSIRDWLLWNDVSWESIASSNDLDTIFWFAKDSITSLLMLIAIWVFLYIWIKLVIARWNPEEFKKSMQHMIYAVIWIFVVSAAWALVNLVAWINL
jgi:hypothetical protein